MAACLHVTAETANLVRALIAGGAQVGLCAANPLSTQDDVVAGAHRAPRRDGAWPRVARAPSSTPSTCRHSFKSAPQVTIDDGADLIGAIHERTPSHAAEMLGGTEETTAGLLRVRALAEQGTLACPVLAVNESRTERAFNDRFGTGQSTIDGILRATNLLLGRAHSGGARLWLDRARRGTARARRRRLGCRLRGRSTACPGGPHGGL